MTEPIRILVINMELENADFEENEGEAIAYTHVHMPFERHARAMPVRHLTVERRPAENWARENEDVS